MSHTDLYRSNHTHHLQSTTPSPAWFWSGETGRRATAKWHKLMLWAVHFKWISGNQSTLIKRQSEDPFWAAWNESLPLDCALRWPLHVSLALHLPCFGLPVKDTSTRNLISAPLSCSKVVRRHPCLWVLWSSQKGVLCQSMNGQASKVTNPCKSEVPIPTLSLSFACLWTGYKEIQGAHIVIAPAETSDPKVGKMTETEEGTIWRYEDKTQLKASA